MEFFHVNRPKEKANVVNDEGIIHPPIINIRKEETPREVSAAGKNGAALDFKYFYRCKDKKDVDWKY